VRVRECGLALAVLAACHASAPERDVPTPIAVHCIAVTRRSLELTETLRGRVAPPPGGELPVASQVPGRIDRLLVREGDAIERGAVVASIDDSASQDALRQADSALAQANAAAANAEVTLERTRQLVDRGIAAKQELDDATARIEAARAGVTAARAAADLARRTLGRVQVRSAFEGVVTRIWRGPGALVDGTSSTPIVEVAASRAAEFVADATERQLQGVDTGQAATIVLASGGEPLEGTVRARSTALDPSTGLGTVRVGIDKPGGLMLGLFGTATVKLGTRDGALVVPAAAMRGAAADGAELVVCNQDKAQVRAVTIGWRDDQSLEIRGGLNDGERIAVDHVLGLETDSPIVEAP
jgi:RND family efflux transporter MFP subunit